MAENGNIECVLIPQFQISLLLPRASVADLLTAEQMNIVVDLQGGIIGKIQYHGWTVPLLSFEAVSQDTIPKFNSKTKALIIHSLADDDSRPYIALTTQGDPEIIELSDRAIKLVNKMKENDFIQSKVLLNAETEAVIPDLLTLVSYTSQYL